MLNATSEAEYTRRFTKFRTHQQVLVNYVIKTWLKWKEKIVKYHVDEHLHFGIRVSSAIEGNHAQIKAYLWKSTSDLKGLYNKLKAFWLVQRLAIQNSVALAKGRPRHTVNVPLFATVLGLVHARGLTHILAQKVKLEKRGSAPGPYCSCTVQKAYGIPCFHTVYERINGGGIQITDIHPF